jgi:uncharacterized protein YxeA
MKRLVNLVQLLIVLAILYPVYYVWDTSRIDKFCGLIKAGMTVAELEQIADDLNISLNTPAGKGETGQWMTSVDATASTDRYACVIIGAVDTVASARIIDE